jgi:hypothetical protein
MIQVDVILCALISVVRVSVLRGGQRIILFANRAKRMFRLKREEAVREIDK